MNRLLHFLLLLFAPVGCAISQSGNSAYFDYIESHKKIAVKEMERAGVPASIKLAQALLESDAGRSELAQKANNHFGIKCGNDWTGKTFLREDDDYDEFGKLQKSCFRKYKSDEESFIAHSEFLRDPKKANRYGFLFRIESTDYRRWAKGLKTAGYATGAGYEDKLISLIERYKLYEYDKKSYDDFFEDRPDKPKDIIAGLDVRRINGARVVLAKNKITPQEISSLTGVSLKLLERYNEKTLNRNDSLADDVRIFLQPKRNAFRGKLPRNEPYHYVRNGQETIYDISQEYGVKLSALYRRNRMPDGSQPQKGQRIKLKGCRIKAGEMPRLDTEQRPVFTAPVIDDNDDGFMDEDMTPQPPGKPEDKPSTDPGGYKPSTGSEEKPSTKPDKPATKPDKPTTPPETPTTQPDTEKPSTGSTVFHTVAKGDTLYNISKRYNLTVDELIRLNNLSSTNISIGQRLLVK